MPKRIKAKVEPRDLADEIIRRVRASTANSDSPGPLPYVVQSANHQRQRSGCSWRHAGCCITRS